MWYLQFAHVTERLVVNSRSKMFPETAIKFFIIDTLTLTLTVEIKQAWPLVYLLRERILSVANQKISVIQNSVLF